MRGSWVREPRPNGVHQFARGANPVVQGSQEDLPGLGGGLLVQLWAAIARPVVLLSCRTGSQPWQALACRRVQTWELVPWR
jgi:hypothetical protein